MSAFRQIQRDDEASDAAARLRFPRFTDTLITATAVCILMSLCSGLCLSSAIAAADPPPRSKGWTAATPPNSRSPHIRFITADTLEGAATITERLKQALQAERESREAARSLAVPEPDPATPVPSQEGISAASVPLRDTKNPDDLAHEKAARFLRLKQQLLQFRAQVAPGPAQVTENGNTEKDNSHESHNSPDPHRNHGNDVKDVTDDADGPNHSPATPDTPLSQNQSGHQPNAAEIPNPVRSAMSDHAVVDGPIDRLGLANNLYAVGDYALALEMYEQADTVNMTAQQQIWTEYQIANCLRRAGKIAEASNRYRRLADQPEAGWLSEQSQWWVEVLEQMRIIRKGLEKKDEADGQHRR